MNFLSSTLDLANCKMLIEIETGIKIFMVLAKSYPNIKSDGVPNSKRPTPNIDCIIIKKIIMLISKIVPILDNHISP